MLSPAADPHKDFGQTPDLHIVSNSQEELPIDTDTRTGIEKDSWQRYDFSPEHTASVRHFALLNQQPLNHVRFLRVLFTMDKNSRE